MFTKKVTQEEYNKTLGMIYDELVALRKDLEEAKNNHTEEYKHIYMYVARFNEKLGHLLEGDS